MIEINMKMPSCCDECFALDDHGDYPYCLISQDQRGYTFHTRVSRMPSCPLKDNEPRVLTLEEVRQHNNQDGCVWFEQPTYNAVAAFVREEGEFEIEVISPYILGEPINHWYWSNSNYNVTWRCWSSKPTDEQRKVVKWNEYSSL